MVDLEKYVVMAEKLKALSHPHRLCIVKGLMDKKCNVTGIRECLDIPQSTVSQHLSRLKSAGIISGERNGLEICYSVVDKDVIKLVESLFN